MSPHKQRDLRAQHVEQTKDIILSAFASLLEQGAPNDVSVSAIAAQADVSERTIYRHFPTRFDLLGGLSSWSRQNVLPLIDLPTLTDLPAVFTQAMAHLDARPQLARALALHDAGREAHNYLIESVRDNLTIKIDEAAPNLSESERRRALAALSYLDSIFAWVKLRDDFDMSSQEIGEVIGWVMTLVIAEISAKNV